ncbi:MAG: DUF2877 domain-containing protein [Bacteroidota bacterium]|nr:DUF2877 domain-containing protein [Bacteroidota bacterium]
MLVNNQIEITSYLNSILSKTNNRFFNIHSVFNKTVNFYDGEILLTFTSPGVQLSPTNIVINESWLFNSVHNLSQNSVCELNYPLLSFNSAYDRFSVSLETCYVVKTEIETHHKLSEKDIELFKSNVFKVIDNRNSILNIFNNHPTEDPLMERFRIITLSIQKSITANDSTNLRKEVTKLLGLGTGLTPAGDDFLYGLLAVWKTLGGRENFVVELETLIIENKNEIGIISYNMLNALIKNHIYLPLKYLFRQINSGKEYTRELSEIATFGSSSGADMIAGLLFGLENQGYKIEA